MLKDNTVCTTFQAISHVASQRNQPKRKLELPVVDTETPMIGYFALPATVLPDSWNRGDVSFDPLIRRSRGSLIIQLELVTNNTNILGTFEPISRRN